MRIWLCSGRAVTMVLAVPTTIPQPPLIEETWWVRVALSLCRKGKKKSSLSSGGIQTKVIKSVLRDLTDS